MQAQQADVTRLQTLQVQADSQEQLPTRQLVTSVDVIAAERVQEQAVANSWELFAQMPGMQLTPFRMGTIGGRFSFRGFNAEGRVNAVKLLIDGIPANNNAGEMPWLDSVFPLDVAAVEVVRGTNDARQGLNAIAGSVDIITRRGGNDGRFSVTAGSRGSTDLQLAKGFENGPWSQNYFIGWRDVPGYRDHALAVKRNFAGKWFYTDPEGRWSAGLSSRYYHDSANEPGYFESYAAARAAPRRALQVAQHDNGELMTAQTALYLDGRWGQGWNWKVRAYVNRYTNQRRVRFSEDVSQQERDNDETQKGFLARLAWRPDARLALESGVDGQWQNNQAQRWTTEAQRRLALSRDWDYDLNVLGGYVQAVIQPWQGWRIVPAYRVDRVSGHLHDLSNGQRYPSYGYGLIRQPKLSVAYRFNPQISGYANWGRTFQIGAGDGAYRTTVHDLGPSLNDGWEAGLKLSPRRWINGRVAWWEQRASGEVATVLGATGTGSDVSNVGRTLRRGWDLQAELQPAGPVSGWLSYTRQRATVQKPAPDAPQTRGQDIENVPHWLAAGGVDWQATTRLKLSAWGNAQGAYQLDRSNTQGRYGSYVLLNLGASWALNQDDQLSLQLHNVADRFLVYAWYDSGSRGFSPGDGRTLYLNWSHSL